MTLGIGCSPITGVVYIGTIRKRKDGTQVWTDNRIDVTNEAIGAVLHHLQISYADLLNGEGEIEISGQWDNGKKYRLTYTESKEEKE